MLYGDPASGLAAATATARSVLYFVVAVPGVDEWGLECAKTPLG